MNVQEQLSNCRQNISSLPEEAANLLIIAETQNACIKMLRFMSFEDVEKLITLQVPALDGLTPIKAIEQGQVAAVYELIDKLYEEMSK